MYRIIANNQVYEYSKEQFKNNNSPIHFILTLIIVSLKFIVVFVKRIGVDKII